MQFLKISKSTTLSDLADQIGDRNVPTALYINGLTRTKYIGKQYKAKCNKIIADSDPITWERQMNILNKFTTDSEIFEEAALQNQAGWKVLANNGSFQDAIQLPDNIELQNSIDTLGNSNSAVSATIYEKVMSSLANPPHYVDLSAFSSYDSGRSVQLVSNATGASNVFDLFKIPWGDISLYDSISGTTIDFPVYPETLADSRTASYTTMQDILFQYEPWQIYTSSGPRSQTYSFHFHRQMWSGNELDGKANELIRFCEACLYPEYKGSAVNTATVKLYVKGNTAISGIMTDVSVSWDGPIGQDGWYLECTLEISITEVAEQRLNHDVVKGLPLIG